jgi:diguanylate cyclase (GGDEF)-like protein
VLARWGGEEFIVFLPETRLPQAIKLAERLRAAIAEVRVVCESGAITLTASVGVAQLDERHATLDALIGSADEALYQAKEQGRNRVAGGTPACLANA